jgi:hypothetical protein
MGVCGGLFKGGYHVAQLCVCPFVIGDIIGICDSLVIHLWVHQSSIFSLSCGSLIGILLHMVLVVSLAFHLAYPWLAE